MNSNSTKLTLKLSPEVSKVMPWLIAAKKSGNPKDVEWAAREYELAEMRARDRERWERQVQDRRERIAFEQRLIAAEQERVRCARLEEQRIEMQRLERLGAHHALEEGWMEFQPSQSSQKGWRRMLSECVDLHDSNRYGMWGDNTSNRGSGHYTVKHNCGRKPRKPWFK